VYLGVHYPLDVVAGAIDGLACAIVVWRLTKGR
jgi:membrane-associated phospholipid phosphatase